MSGLNETVYVYQLITLTTQEKHICISLQIQSHNKNPFGNVWLSFMQLWSSWGKKKNPSWHHFNNLRATVLFRSETESALCASQFSLDLKLTFFSVIWASYILVQHHVALCCFMAYVSQSRYPDLYFFPKFEVVKTTKTSKK